MDVWAGLSIVYVYHMGIVLITWLIHHRHRMMCVRQAARLRGLLDAKEGEVAGLWECEVALQREAEAVRFVGLCVLRVSVYIVHLSMQLNKSNRRTTPTRTRWPRSAAWRRVGTSRHGAGSCGAGSWR